MKKYQQFTIYCQNNEDRESIRCLAEKIKAFYTLKGKVKNVYDVVSEGLKLLENNLK